MGWAMQGPDIRGARDSGERRRGPRHHPTVLDPPPTPRRRRQGRRPHPRRRLPVRLPRHGPVRQNARHLAAIPGRRRDQRRRPVSGIEIDTTEVRQIAADAGRLPGELSRWLRPAVSRGALNIKRALQADLEQSGNAGIRHVARSISYDLTDTGTTVEAEIGPDKPSGALANIAYFGTSRGGGHTRDPIEPLTEEAEAFQKAVSDIVEDLWG
nr:MAG TPA: hypothetical protein [Caudoviricetes sp.]